MTADYTVVCMGQGPGVAVLGFTRDGRHN